MSRREEFVGVRVIDHVESDGPCYSQWLTDEPIVRCRDCEYAQVRHPLNPITGIPAGIEDWRCDYFWNADELPEVEPDGFCAWGKRRNG